MNESPIYVCAKTHSIAENFIANDMHESPSRLRFIDCGEKLYGLSYILLYMHPSADRMYEYEGILRVARERGCIFANIEDYFARQRYSTTQRDHT